MHLTQLLMINQSRLIKVVAGVLSLLCAVGCDFAKMKKCPSYVATYIDIQGLKLETTSDKMSVEVNPSQGFSNEYDFLAEDSKFAYKYESLCRKHNDLSYNQKISVINGYDFTAQTFISEDFDSIKVTSDKDYDEKHTAGESLNDLCRFVAFSPYKFISSGYKDYYNYSKDNVSKTLAKLAGYLGISEGQKLTCHPIDKMLSDVTAKDLILLGYDNPYPLFRLHFESKPVVSGEHQITVEVRTDEGKIYTATITMNFVADN